MVATVAVAALGMTGVMPMRFTANDTVVAGITLPRVVPVFLLGVVATAIALPRWASAVSPGCGRVSPAGGLAEVPFAVLAAWLMLGEKMVESR